mmetsp:Transcript_2496/g.4522  ORF Transcript_2496/g.4522 Transcript_2496/m.4522 type:complete len:213 (+) Transcript_2496:62-700(+)
MSGVRSVYVRLTCKYENGALMRGARYWLLLGLCVVPVMSLWLTVVCGCSNTTVRESTNVLKPRISVLVLTLLCLCPSLVARSWGGLVRKAIFYEGSIALHSLFHGRGCFMLPIFQGCRKRESVLETQTFRVDSYFLSEDLTSLVVVSELTICTISSRTRSGKAGARIHASFLVHTRRSLEICRTSPFFIFTPFTLVSFDGRLLFLSLLILNA